MVRQVTVGLAQARGARMKRDRWASDGSSESESEAQSRPKSDAQSRPKVRRDDERTGTPENRASARPEHAAHELAESDRNGDDHHAIGLDGEVDGSRARALDAGDGAEANGAEEPRKNARRHSSHRSQNEEAQEKAPEPQDNPWRSRGGLQPERGHIGDFRDR